MDNKNKIYKINKIITYFLKISNKNRMNKIK